MDDKEFEDVITSIFLGGCSIVLYLLIAVASVVAVGYLLHLGWNLV